MSSMSFFCVAPGVFSNVQTRPSRSQTQSSSVPGTNVRPTELVKSRFVKALTADQLPEMAGAISGMEPLRNAPMAGRESRP